MTDHQRLQAVRALHTAIYVVMACACLVLFYGAATGRHGPWLWIAGALAALESVVFIASGLACPLTAVTVRYGATREGVADTFFPERMTRHTLHVFGPILAAAAVLVVCRVVWLGWA